MPDPRLQPLLDAIAANIAAAVIAERAAAERMEEARRPSDGEPPEQCHVPPSWNGTTMDRGRNG
jgi:hypothetical protein